MKNQRISTTNYYKKRRKCTQTSIMKKPRQRYVTEDLLTEVNNKTIIWIKVMKVKYYLKLKLEMENTLFLWRLHQKHIRK